MKPGVRDFYRGRCVLVTGATGFLGKALVEKLLRSCPEVDTIYLLIRSKQGNCDVQSRLDQLLQNPLFDRLKSENPETLTKLYPICGDIGMESLGMTTDHWKLLVSRVSIVIHSAATVKFDERLSKSLDLNVIGLRRLVSLCRDMKCLKALVHISTAYSNCDQAYIEEKVYTPPLGSIQILAEFDKTSDFSDFDMGLNALVKSCRPNTYTYTKAIAENVLTMEARDLPVCIVRPSVVTASWKEPMSGWIDNINGPTGIFAAAATGALRVGRGDPSKRLNLIPIDIVVNLIICAAWETGTQFEFSTVLAPQVYNCCSPAHGLDVPNNQKLLQLVTENFRTVCPLLKAVRYPSTMCVKNLVLYWLAEIAFSYRPGILLNLVCTPKTTRISKSYRKLRRAIAPLQYFTLREWQFSTNNVLNLYNKLSDGEKQTFNFVLDGICWPDYVRSYCIGIRKYLMREEDDSLQKARDRMKRLYRNYAMGNFVVVMAAVVSLGLIFMQ